MSATLDEIERRVLPPATSISRGIAGMRHVQQGLEGVTAAVAMVNSARAIARRLPAPRRTLAIGGVLGLLGAVWWMSHPGEASDKRSRT